MSRKPNATIESVTNLASGFLKLNRYVISVDRHDGGRRTITWELMERGHSVGVLGYDPNRDEVVLVNEMRPGALAAGDYPFLEQLVAGALQEGEPIIDAAVREMKEETGLDLVDPVVIHPGAYASSGGTTEKIAIVFGKVDTSRAGGVHGADENEDILTVVRPAEDFIRAVRTGEITDMKTLVAGYWLAEHREAQRKPRG
ncbi:MAG: NUDIX domain-containing protein [Gammaproteobacteria bacterium]|nr:ADP-ribose diphosphatase [Gammaproteobacteria bacterium]